MADPLIARTIANTAGLRAPVAGAPVAALATYADSTGKDLFTIEREGIRLLPGERVIPNSGIAEIRLHDPKAAAPNRKLLLILVTGEQIDLTIEGENGSSFDIYPLQAFLRRRIHQQRPRS